MRRRTVRVGVRTSLAALVAVLFLLPFAFLLLVAFKPAADYLASPLGMPTSFTLEHLSGAWERARLGRALVNSLTVSGVGVVVAGLLSMSAAFWFLLHNGRRAASLRWTMVAGYAFPAVIWLIPLFVLLARSGLTDDLVVLGTIYGVSNLPFGIYLMHTFYRQVLRTEILEAAALDGASVLAMFRHIAVPLARPAVAALAALVFVWSFGDLLFAVTMLQSPARWTLPMAAASLVSQQSISTPAQAAAALVALSPSLLVVLVAQRALVRGFAGGSVTG